MLYICSCAAVMAYDLFDPTANITITWDVISWTPDGYVAVVKMHNYQMYRQISSPGWTIGWTWEKKEIIWSIVGAQVTDQGDCKEFPSNIPHSCEKSPRIIDLQPGAPYNQQFLNCCKGGIVTSLGQDPQNSLSSFQLSVGNSGNTYKTVSLPKNFSFLGPNLGYTCSPVSVVPSSVSLSSGGHRKNRALMTWQLVCSYSQFLASNMPSCCVSLSTFYNSDITPCPSCACGCINSEACAMSDLAISREGAALVKKCTPHMCPIRVHWHVKKNYKAYWRVKITITNFIYNYNYTKWTLLAQHPNLNDVAKVDNFNYKPLQLFDSINDTGMFYGIGKLDNDLLLQAGLNGSVYTEMILKKDRKMFTLNYGWAFPRIVYFNGDECVMPLPVSYPSLPNSAHLISDIQCVVIVIIQLLAAAVIYIFP
uniref:COBRA-like protein 4 n=1 Tax=Erigeron canadensis TaxID=72917 RepID=UPI001CB9847D|nr:COBRA-like protein 4 [Erigeron canadensis]